MRGSVTAASDRSPQRVVVRDAGRGSCRGGGGPRGSAQRCRRGRGDTPVARRSRRDPGRGRRRGARPSRTGRRPSGRRLPAARRSSRSVNHHPAATRRWRPCRPVPAHRWTASWPRIPVNSRTMHEESGLQGDDQAVNGVRRRSTPAALNRTGTCLADARIGNHNQRHITTEWLPGRSGCRLWTWPTTRRESLPLGHRECDRRRSAPAVLDRVGTCLAEAGVGGRSARRCLWRCRRVRGWAAGRQARSRVMED
jgi:hypothetical protein